MTTASANIDILILVAFLVLNLIVGLKYRGKTQTFKEYAIGDKKFSTATLTATVVATWMSGSALFIDLENTYSSGLYYMVAILIGTIVGFFLITSRVLGPRMGKFLNNVSVPECLGILYGKPVQTIAGIGTVLSNVGYIAIQFKVISKILAILFDYDSSWVTIIAAAIIILYSMSGGVKAVTFTDVIQFFTFGTLLPVLALVIWNKVKDPSKVAYMLNHNPLFSFKEVIGWTPEFMGTIALIGYFIVPELPPQLFQRIAMARDVTQVRRSMTYASAVLLAITLCTMWIAVLLLVAHPGLEPSQVVPHLVNEYTYPGLKGFLGIGVIALAMSTADSALNSCAVVITNDILPFWPKQKKALKVAKGATLVLGSLALLMALRELDLLDLLLLSASFYAPIVTIPMLLTIFGFQTSSRVVLMAIAVGVTTVVTCLVCFKSVNSFFPGMIANGIVLLGAHYLLGEKGGWGNNPVERDLTTLPQGNTWKERLAATRQFKLYPYLERVLPQQKHAYPLLGFYIFTTTYALLYLLPPTVASQYPKLYSSIQYSVTMIITSFLAFPIWPKPLQSSRFLVWIWPMSILYALFVVGGILVIMSGFALPQMLLLALNFVMALLLLHWPLAMGMAIGGIFVAIYFFKQYTGLENLPGDLGSLQFKIIYGLLLLSSFLITLFKHKQAYYNLARYNALLTQERQVTNEELIKALHAGEQFFTTVGTEGNDLLEAVTQKVEKFKQQAQQITTVQQLTPTSQILQEVNTALKDTMDYLRNVAYRAQNYLRLEVNTMPIDELLTEILAVLKVQDIEARNQLRIMNTTSYQTLECDTARIQQLLINAVLYAQHSIPKSSYNPIFLYMQETFLGYPLTSVKNYIKEVVALRITVTRAKLPPVTKALYMSTMNGNNFWLPQSREALGLFDNQRIVDAHYGITEFIKGEDGLTQTYVIPVRLREVRPPMMDIPQMEIGKLGKGTQEVLPEETILLTRLQEETIVDITLVEKAIKTIKKFHSQVKRKSGEPFYLHPIAATEILLDYAQDQAAVLATLLHDTVEDTPLTLSEIGVIFGPDVAAIVNKVTHLEGRFHRIKMNPQENIRQLLEETDIRVLQVKLADRIHNMRTIEGHTSLAKQKKIADETLHFFVPITKYLGLKQVEEELQETIAKVSKRR